MAKKKTKKKTTRRIRIEFVGLILILLGLFGSGASMLSDGFIPATLDNFFRFFFGMWYFIIPISFIILGFYFIWKRKMPKLISKKWIGFYILFISVLLLSHIQTMQQLTNKTTDLHVFTETWQQYKIYIDGNGTYKILGGGFTGAIILVITKFLFSFIGAKILSIVGIVIGIVIIANIKTDHIQNAYYKIQSLFTRKNQSKETSKSTKIENSNKLEQKDVEDDYAIDNQKEEDIEVQVIENKKDTSVEQLDLEEFTPIHQANEHYTLPSLSLLNDPLKHSQQQDKSGIRATVKLLEDTFESFGVKAKITKANVGPAVTKYEVHPEAGVKVSRIVNLQDDLALALAAQDIRIEAPIPGKSAVGIEVPNNEVAPVSLKEVLDVSSIQDKKLLFALGKDISGNVVQGELNKMPHILIAGATGSGKSVCINGIITSILMRATPDEVKMMMIDPKKVELNVYNGIPHLLTPVVTDPKKASMALRKIVAEMEYRYELFSETGTRNLESYNNYVRKYNEQNEEPLQPLPYIVVLVDELADLMMVASNDVEDSITRLAQMARAAGIHLIIATQRPSVDVITGVIKANIPSRIAFSVSSQVDSRTILDMSGAEKLLGRGDMLYIPVGMSKPIRVQGAFLSDEEVERIVTHCKNEQNVQYEEEMIPDEPDESPEGVEDELYVDAVQFIIEKQTASVSMLQRRFSIGYNRAARLIDMMEERNIIGPSEGNKARSVLVEREEDEKSS